MLIVPNAGVARPWTRQPNTLARRLNVSARALEDLCTFGYAVNGGFAMYDRNDFFHGRFIRVPQSIDNLRDEFGRSVRGAGSFDYTNFPATGNYWGYTPTRGYTFMFIVAVAPGASPTFTGTDLGPYFVADASCYAGPSRGSNGESAGEYSIYMKIEAGSADKTVYAGPFPMSDRVAHTCFLVFDYGVETRFYCDGALVAAGSSTNPRAYNGQVIFHNTSTRSRYVALGAWRRSLSINDMDWLRRNWTGMVT